MPQFNYKGRDKEGRLRSGQRMALTIDGLNADLIKEGITPIEISPVQIKRPLLDKLHDRIQGEALHLEELSIFARQMELLHRAGVPMVTALKQIASFTRSYRLSHALHGVIQHLEMGQDLATAMQYFPEAFSQLIVNIVQIGESSGHLSEAFGHLHTYLQFESTNIKRLKSSFRYPLFVLFSIAFAIITLNVFVIPTFTRFYVNLEVGLPWQTRILVATSNFFIHYGYLLLALFIGGSFLFYRYINTPEGKYRWHKLLLNIPVIGKLVRRIILIRFCQSLAIVVNSGIPISQGLILVKNLLQNAYINREITQAQEAIERGTQFTQAIAKINLISPLELQILAVGEKNGELGPALQYVGDFHAHEIEFDLKRMNDIIGPVLISAVSVLILIIALGVYLPIWNMINLVHS